MKELEFSKKIIDLGANLDEICRNLDIFNNKPLIDLRYHDLICRRQQYDKAKKIVKKMLKIIKKNRK